jgi:hypothetical protein
MCNYISICGDGTNKNHVFEQKANYYVTRNGCIYDIVFELHLKRHLKAFEAFTVYFFSDCLMTSGLKAVWHEVVE